VQLDPALREGETGFRELETHVEEALAVVSLSTATLLVCFSIALIMLWRFLYGVRGPKVREMGADRRP